jgi:hypothetical protein
MGGRRKQWLSAIRWRGQYSAASKPFFVSTCPRDSCKSTVQLLTPWQPGGASSPPAKTVQFGDGGWYRPSGRSLGGILCSPQEQQAPRPPEMAAVSGRHKRRKGPWLAKHLTKGKPHERHNVAYERFTYRCGHSRAIPSNAYEAHNGGEAFAALLRWAVVCSAVMGCVCYVNIVVFSSKGSHGGRRETRVPSPRLRYQPTPFHCLLPTQPWGPHNLARTLAGAISLPFCPPLADLSAATPLGAQTGALAGRTWQRLPGRNAREVRCRSHLVTSRRPGDTA